MNRILAASVLSAYLILTTGTMCPGDSPSLPNGDADSPRGTLNLVATSSIQWTGVAVSREGRIFVNYPRWRAGLAHSVAEIELSGGDRMYPSESWNDWTDSDTAYQVKFICVQSVYVDDEDFLWVLDSGNPYLQGVRPGVPKLVKITLSGDAVVRTYFFDGIVFASQRYLNDVRVDTRAKVAYVSESGLGSLIVVDLDTGKSRYALDRHISTIAENITVTVEGRPFLSRVHCDGIALTADASYLYFKSLTATRLYRLKTESLRDTALSSGDLGDLVEPVKDVGVSDGMEFGPDGSLFITSLQMPSHDLRIRTRWRSLSGTVASNGPTVFRSPIGILSISPLRKFILDQCHPVHTVCTGLTVSPCEVASHLCTRLGAEARAPM